MKVFITGGCGQIGSHIAEMLLARGDEVLAIDNLATGRREHLQEHPNLRVVVDTIANKEIVDSLVSDFRPDAIVHTAASYKNPDDWYNDTLTNCVGGANVIHAAKNFGVRRFVYFQTALCYGVKPLQIMVHRTGNRDTVLYGCAEGRELSRRLPILVTSPQFVLISVFQTIIMIAISGQCLRLRASLIPMRRKE